MNCEHIREILSDEIDGEAGDSQLTEAYRHLGGCTYCRVWRREMLIIEHNFGEWGDSPVPEAVTSRLREQTPSPRNRRVYRISRPLAWAAAAAIVLQLGWTSFNLLRVPGQDGWEAEIPARIVLTNVDRTSSKMIVENQRENGDRQHREQNGG